MRRPAAEDERSGRHRGLQDVRISAGAAGAVVVLFPGRAESAASQPALFAASLQALDTLDQLGVRPIAGVGYGLAEITGLTWAGSISAAEGARLVAQYGQVLQACACGPAAMARVTADAEVARALGAPGPPVPRGLRGTPDACAGRVNGRHP